MDAGTHRYFDISSDEFDGALKVMVMKDEAIVLTAAVMKLLPPGTNATNYSWHTWKPHASNNSRFYLPQTSPQGKALSPVSHP